MEQGFVECNSTNLPKLDFNMIYEFMINENANEAAGTSKEERSARPTYGDKAIGKVQLKRDGSTCVVKARITPEHSIRKSAYNVTCTIDEVGKKIIHAQCEDCPASEGKYILPLFIINKFFPLNNKIMGIFLFCVFIITEPQFYRENNILQILKPLLSESTLLWSAKHPQ
uniref:Uncharacterized protein n=1 Tax=Cacopsylla melanoneura TaxID=428564 RepID=A0A8D8X9Z8_9HEMI